EDVIANLVSPRDFALGADDFGKLRVALGFLELLQFRLNDAQPDAFVLRLAAFVDAFHGDSGRNVLDPDGRRDFIHVLAAGARRAAEAHDIQLLLIQLDVAFVEHRQHRDRGEARLPLALRIERADPHESVYAVLALEITERERTADLQIDRGDAGAIAIL